MNILFLFRKEDAIKLDLIHIAKLDNNGTRFFYQKKKFQLPQYVPHSLPGTVFIHLFIEGRMAYYTISTSEPISPNYFFRATSKYSSFTFFKSGQARPCP